jgi:branched-chain amino acid transport system substrate-binding protein
MHAGEGEIGEGRRPRGRGPARPAPGLLAAAVAALALAACGRDGAPKQPAPAPSAPSAAAAPSSAAPVPPRVRGVGPGELLLGMASPFSGANRELGRAMKAGVEAAFAAVNAEGGVHGRKLRLVALDDGYEPSRTLPALRELVEKEGVFAVVGNVGTPTAAVAIPYCLERKVVFFGAFSGGDLLRKSPPDRYVFNFRPSYAEETSAAVRWLVRTRRIDPRRIAVFSQDDEFGESGWRGAERELAAHGVDPASVVRARYKRNTADVGVAVALLKERARAVDAVVMVATYEAAASFIRRTHDAGLSIAYTDVSAVDSNALSEGLVSAGARYARDVMVTQVVPMPASKAPAAVRYQQALARFAPAERPGFVALEGFVVADLLVEGLRRAGRELDGDKLVAALEGLQGLDLGTGAKLGFGPAEHQASHKVWGTVLQADGAYRQIELP